MRPISQKIKSKFKQEKCHCCQNIGNERHHALIYGRQIDEDFAIIPLCSKCHRGNFGTIFKDVKEKCELRAINNGLEVLKVKYPKENWEQKLKYLKSKYENRDTD